MASTPNPKNKAPAPVLFPSCRCSSVGTPADSNYTFTPEQVKKIEMLIRENKSLHADVASYRISDSLQNVRANSSEMQLINCQEINRLKDYQLQRLESTPVMTVIDNRKWYEPPLYGLAGIAVGIVLGLIFIK
jgi:hypothetical protein